MLLPHDLYPLHSFSFHLWSLDLPLVTKNRKEHVPHQHRESQTPDQSDGIKEVGISRAGINPKMVEGGS